MRKKIILFFLLALPMLTAAQSLRFAYFSYENVLKSMAGYTKVKEDLATLRAQYEAELLRSENDFHAKYEDFLEGQKDFAPSILRRRQAELQELMDKNKAFKEETKRLFQQAEEEMLGNLKQRLNNTIKQMGRENGYAFILNTDNNTLPYVDTLVGEDITNKLISVLK